MAAITHERININTDFDTPTVTAFLAKIVSKFRGTLNANIQFTFSVKTSRPLNYARGFASEILMKSCSGEFLERLGMNINFILWL